MIIAKNISTILEYFKNEESILHQKIGLHSRETAEEFQPTLIAIKNEFPTLQIEYMKLEREDKNKCIPSPYDLSIVVPFDILKGTLGVFKYSFQSHIKNRYGTLTIEVIKEKGVVRSINEQFFITSIGD